MNNTSFDIKDFLNFDFPWKFDMKNLKFLGKNSIDLALQYKFFNENWDCDGSGVGNIQSINNLIREIYRIIWNWDDKIKDDKHVKRYAPIFEKYEGLLFQPETMTSFLTTFKSIINNTLLLKEKYVCSSKFFELANDKKRTDAKTEFIRDTINNKDIELYCSNVGRIGNMTLTLAGYNIYIFKDYWDLKIAQQYLNNEMLTTKFKNEYINTFFMWDYVEYNNEKNTYKEKLFFADHRKEILPKSEKKMKSFLSIVDKYINRRGFFITLLLILKFKNIDTYNEIFTLIINNNVHTMNDAINCIFQKVDLENIEDDILNHFEDETIQGIYMRFKNLLFE